MAREKVSPRIYKRFIDSLHLKSIQAIDYSAKKEEDFSTPAKINIKQEQRYKKIEKKDFKVYHKYRLEATQEGKSTPGFYAEVTYFLLYSSDVPITKAIFDIFSKLNLPLHTWPYFREFIHSTTLRMHLPPLVLDVLKMG